MRPPEPPEYSNEIPYNVAMRSGDPWTALGRSMAAGALYDSAFAVAILGFAKPASRLLGVPVPEDRAYFGLLGVFLAMLAAIYLLVWRDPRRYRGIAVVAAIGRAAGFVYLGAVWASGREPAFLALGLADLGFAVWHVAALRRARADGP